MRTLEGEGAGGENFPTDSVRGHLPGNKTLIGPKAAEYPAFGP